MRHGCTSLVQLEIMPQPPLERAADNPWPEWPKVYKLDYGQEEAAAKFGADPRVYLTTVKKFVGDARRPARRNSSPSRSSGRRTTRASSCRTKCPAPSRRAPPSSCCWRWASSAPSSRCSKDLGVERDPRSNVKAEHEPVHDQPQGRLRRRRLPPRPEPRRLGHQRGPRRRPRVRPLPDGQDRSAVSSMPDVQQEQAGEAGEYGSCLAMIVRLL